MPHPLDAFLNPQSVAMIGVSPNPSFANAILNSLVRLQYRGKVFPVNPNYQEIAGLKAYPRIADIPESVELAILSVPSRMVPDVLAQCERKGVTAVNILTSGFGEISGEEGQRRQQFLSDYVARTGVRIVGPNCFGNVSLINNFPGMAGTYPACKPGVLGLAFQSGGLAVNVVGNLIDRQVGFSHAISTGNESDIEVADCLRYFAEDERTRVIGAFVEQFRNPRAFIDAAEICAAQCKPIVMIKVGRSEAGQRAAAAHTGSLAGTDKIIDATLRKLGVIRVHHLDEMFETMCIMHARKLPRGDGVGAITFSGGAVGTMSDLAEEIGIDFTPIHEEGQQRIREVLYEYGTVNNPIDLTGQAVYDPPVQKAAFDAMGTDPNIHTIMVFSGGTAKMDAQSPIGKVVLRAVADYPEKVFVRTSQMAGSFREKPFGMPDFKEPVADLDGIPFMQGVENSLRAVHHLNGYAAFQQRRRQAPPPRSTVDVARQAHARAIIGAARGEALTESAGKQLLNLYCIPVTKERLANNADDAAAIATQMGFPVAMKIVSPQILHKTDAGGVALGVADARAASEAYERIMAACRAHSPQADLQGVLVQEMVGRGRELIVGMTNDPAFGPGIVLGLGGIFVEILKDAVLRVPPLTAGDAREMIESLKGKAILTGARGQKASDLPALVDVLLNFSRLCEELRDDIAEIDINPLIVLDEGQGAKAVDCLIVPREARQERSRT